jgi:hypothetical protein
VSLQEVIDGCAGLGIEFGQDEESHEVALFVKQALGRAQAPSKVDVPIRGGKLVTQSRIEPFGPDDKNFTSWHESPCLMPAFAIFRWSNQTILVIVMTPNSAPHHHAS